MAIATKEEFLDYVSGLTVIELVDHIEAMEEKFGVTAAAAAVATGGATASKKPIHKDNSIHIHVHYPALIINTQ